VISAKFGLAEPGRRGAGLQPFVAPLPLEPVEDCLTASNLPIRAVAADRQCLSFRSK